MDISEQKQLHLLKLFDRLVTFEESPLFSYRMENNYKPVLGEGNSDASVMFIGEAPGRNEAEQGGPFIGSAGKVLSGLLEHAGLSREDVFITSVVHDRPPKNKTPTKKITAAYKPFIIELITLIQPKVIVTLGRVPLATLLSETTHSSNIAMEAFHGQPLPISFHHLSLTFFPMYHPAAVLYNRQLSEVLTQDFTKLGMFLSDAGF